MVKVLKKTEENGFLVTEYTKDGETVSHTVKTPIPQETGLEDIEPTIEEEILYENKYQTILLEMGMM